MSGVAGTPSDVCGCNFAGGGSGLRSTVAAVLRSPLPPPAKLQPQTSDGVPATPLKGLGSSHGGSTIAGVDLGSRAAYIRTTVIAPLMLVITLVIGSQISFAGWVRAKPTASHAIALHVPALHAAALRATALHVVALRATALHADRLAMRRHATPI